MKYAVVHVCEVYGKNVIVRVKDSDEWRAEAEEIAEELANQEKISLTPADFGDRRCEVIREAKDDDLQRYEIVNVPQKPQRLYAVLVREGDLRDTQMRCYSEEDTAEEYDENDDNWSDFSGPGFVGFVFAENEEAACIKIAEEEGYDVRNLVAQEAPERKES